jgi:hypothetical protein
MEQNNTLKNLIICHPEDTELAKNCLNSKYDTFQWQEHPMVKRNRAVVFDHDGRMKWLELVDIAKIVNENFETIIHCKPKWFEYLIPGRIKKINENKEWLIQWHRKHLTNNM